MEPFAFLRRALARKDFDKLGHVLRQIALHSDLTGTAEPRGEFADYEQWANAEPAIDDVRLEYLREQAMTKEDRKRERARSYLMGQD